MLRLSRLAFLMLLLGSSAIARGWAQNMGGPVEVKTRQGRLHGSREANLCVFRGIPYAQPPVGPLRFRPPQPLPRQHGPRPATQFGHRAVQAGGPTGVQGSEDCLYLNVWAPAWPTRSRPAGVRPVVVWVHGGAFTGGSGQDNDTWTFAAQDSVVAVSLNYRLGSLGFLHLGEALGPAYRQAGNVGLLDAVAALRWVHDNIRAFGGDPTRVTLMGESAGAKLVGALLVTPAAEGLFQQVILESGAVQAIRDTATAAAVTRQLLGELHLAQPQALLTLPADTLIRAQARFASGAGGLQVFGPVQDGLALPQPPFAYLRRLKRRPPAVLLGTNLEEAGLFTGPGSVLAQPNEKALQQVFGRNAAAVWAAYRRLSQTQPAQQAWNTTLTDYLYRLATYRLADTLAAQNRPVWLYRFDWHNATQRPLHAQELAFVWNAPLGSSGAAPTLPASLPGKAADAALAARMHAYWARFIKTGRPGPDWPAYSAPGRMVMVFDSASGPRPAPDAYRDPGFPTQAYRR
ncbi:carboxylesterase/lipase family protein [Hymenobacter lutimineralis]|uniref:Carboxylic ester hydrolase n=1 Tax=Hymenobacter lutimineralis TaxID=2606448 RepID=A0A5D6V1C5_9BACT|nr:carboxylesterase family protein [Hymenobacter lutimineralis]TYZ08828.1 carboxylesterase/lipase family protein [Hymenobacter lutimineralis]